MSPSDLARQAVLDELRRRIQGLEQRMPIVIDDVHVARPRLPPGALMESSSRRGCGLAELEGATGTEWGATFSTVIEPRRAVEPRREWAAIAAQLAGLEAAPNGLLESIRIVDIETTGLAGGTGTLAFLIGIGRFEGPSLRVEQLLLGGPGDEPAFLDELAVRLRGGTLLITFNGRSFDVPLLRTRCVLARRPPGALATLPHLDLLPPARRLWRSRAPDCRLVTLEAYVLQRARVEDVPGSMAPLAYGEFLRGGDASGLGAIVAHNREDIIGTAALLTSALRLLAGPFAWAEDAGELRGVAQHRARHDGPGAAVPVLERALVLARSAPLRRKLWPELARLHRRLGALDAAERAWRAYAMEFAGENRGFVEVAKLLEHRRRDFSGALAMICAAPHRAAIDVEMRVQRLHRKAGKSVSIRRAG